jgi:type IV pilus assembly protein PilB
LNIIIAQRLVRKICKYCKQEEIMPLKMLNEIEEDIKTLPKTILEENDLDLLKALDKLKFYKGVGCARCGNTGFKGRMAIIEILEVNKKIQEFIMNKTILKLEDVVSNQNFTTMKQDGLIKSLRGETTLGEVLRVIRD